MAKLLRLILISLAVIMAIGLAVVYLSRRDIAIFNPAGIVARQERQLIIITLLLSIIVVVPVFGLLFWIIWHYRESNHNARYSPELDGNRLAETIWWLIPSAIILILAVITWNSSHQLDPYRPLASAVQPLKIQVVALDWKWLFIYPEQNVAAVNLMPIPLDTPIDLEITADAPMNSFWVPQLAGQIYAMPGMVTQLHLMADKAGDYNGVSANISGRGFAGMRFVAQAETAASFKSWVQTARQSPVNLDSMTYQNLSQPSQYNRPTVYASVEPGLRDTIVSKYIGQPMMSGMNM